MSMNDIVEIIPHLYISNWETSNNPYILKKYNIKAVISLETTPKPDYILDYYNKNKIEHMYIYIHDSPDVNISEHFDETYEFIHKHIQKGDNVLVHCMAGISRSSTIILNYMLRISYESGQGNSCPCNLFKSVLEYARKQRPIINPNSGFQKQLLQKAMEYQHTWKKGFETLNRNIRASIY